MAEWVDLVVLGAAILLPAIRSNWFLLQYTIAMDESVEDHPITGGIGYDCVPHQREHQALNN